MLNVFKVAYVIYQEPRKLSDGGVRSISLIIQELARNGVVPTIITNLNTPQTGEWRRLNCHIIVLPFTNSPDRPNSPTTFMTGSQLIPQLIEVFKESDVVHCNDTISMYLTAWSVRAANKKLITHVRDTFFSDYFWSISRVISDHMIVLSKEMGNRLASEVSGPAKITQIYSIVDEPIPFVTGEHSKNIAIIGHLQPKKQQLEFIKYALSSKKIRDMTLYLLGSNGEDKYAHECLIEGTKSSSVVFSGHQLRMSEWYSRMNAILIPSKYEGLSRAMIEGMWYRVPIISTAVCSAREIIEENNAGYVVSPGRFDLMLDHAWSLAEYPPLQQMLGKNAHQAASRLFDKNKIVPQYLKLYKELKS